MILIQFYLNKIKIYNIYMDNNIFGDKTTTMIALILFAVFVVLACMKRDNVIEPFIKN